MKKKINKKLLNLIALCSGITATVGLGVGGVIYSLRQEKVEQNILPESVYKFSEDGKTLLGFKDEFLNDPTSPIYKDNFKGCNTMEIPASVISINDEAFIDDYTLPQPNSTIPSFIKKLTFAEGSNCSSIGDYAFGLSPLTSITFPSGLKSIGDAGFGRSKLISVTFPDSLTTIGNAAFANCWSLTSVDLSNTNLSTLEYGVFGVCSSLTTIHFPSSLESIGRSAFENATALKTITLPEALTTIGNYAFYNCSSLTSIAFPSSLTTIGEAAFQECSALTSVGFPNYTNLSTINDRTFLNCSKLTSIDLSNVTNLTTIGSKAFGSCSELTSVTFPSSLITIKSNAFEECSKLNDIKWKSWTGNIDNLDQTSFSGVCPTGGTVTVTNPSGHESDELLEYLLEKGGLPSTWAKIPLPEDVYNINENNVLLGFKEGIDLNQYDGTCNTMEIPARVTSIGNRAFYSGSGSTIPDFIKKLTFAEGSNCSTIGSNTFAWADSLTSITLPSVLTTISSGAFVSCSSLTSLSFPSSLTKIGNSAFSSSNLNHIEWNLPTNYQSSITIDDYAFYSIPSTGSVKSLNTSITSQQLFDWIKTKGRFPSTGWGPAD